MTNAEKLMTVAYIILANFGSFSAMIMIYTNMIKKQAKIEYLVKRVCDKLDISTDTHL